MPRSNESTIRDTERAREVAARRTTETITCENCGAVRQVIVKSGARRARTCGAARCRMALMYRRRRAERAGATADQTAAEGALSP